MPIPIACPSCARSLRVPQDLLGQSVRCPNCQTTFTAAAPAPLPAPPPSEGAVGVQTASSEPQPSRDWNKDEDDYPRPPNGYSDIGAFQGQPHRGTLVMSLGIIGLAIAVIGMCPYLTLGEFVAFGLSLAAWLMGRRDLAAIQQGEMDPRGKDSTQVGWICGIIGTCLSALAVVFVCALIVFYVVIIIFAAANGK